ncbi:MAG TPA: pyridoxamine 5'-phosphate oxidase family protein [Tepidisphaeraceae bacterium]|jgi:pyridoxamine 5'-phosphate oxidase
MEIPWLEALRAAEREAGRPMILSLATVDDAGDPQVRSVVCRRVDDRGMLWIASDARSVKHRQLAMHPRAAAVAWFPATREQFRFSFSGSVQILGGSSESSDRVELWRSLAPETRATFFWPDPGGLRTAGDDAFAKTSDVADPPPSFELLVLHPTAVDHLVLTAHPHRRRRWTSEGQWALRELNA